MRSVVREWVEDWYCYWDGRDAYVFEPPLRVAPSGLVTAGSERGCARRECVATALLAARRNQAGAGALPQLPALAWALILKDAVASARHWAALDGAERAVLQMVGARPIGLGDESDYCWEPFVCSWSVEDGALTPVSLLQRVGQGAEPTCRTCRRWSPAAQCPRTRQHRTSGST